MNLRDKKSRYDIEIRKQGVSDFVQYARRQKSTRGMIPFDAEAFQRNLDTLFSAKKNESLMLEKLKETRMMSNDDNFKLRNEQLNQDFCFFIAEVVTDYFNNIEIMVEITHFLTNCFYEENAVIFITWDVIETLKQIGKHDNKLVVDNLLHILWNISFVLECAQILINKFGFFDLTHCIDKKESLKNADNKVIALIGNNILERIPDVEYHKVR